jgi:hypothetical protein
MSIIFIEGKHSFDVAFPHMCKLKIGYEVFLSTSSSTNKILVLVVIQEGSFKTQERMVSGLLEEILRNCNLPFADGVKC